MGHHATEVIAPSGDEIIEKLAARLPEIGDTLSPNIPRSAIPLLINRFRPIVRQALFDFVANVPTYDLPTALSLVLINHDSENTTYAVIKNLDTVRKLNLGRDRSLTYSSLEDIRNACKLASLKYRDIPLQGIDFATVIAAHIVNVMGTNLSLAMIKRLGTHIYRNPDFTAKVAPAFVALIELARTLPDQSSISIETIIDVVDAVHENPSERLRITEVIRTHNGFSKALMDEVLASEATALDGGVL